MPADFPLSPEDDDLKRREAAAAIARKWRNAPYPLTSPKLVEADAELATAIASLRDHTGSSTRELAACLATRGILLRDHGRSQEGLGYLVEAVALAGTWDNHDPAALDEEADLWMNHGICLLNLGTPPHLKVALPSFERAIALRLKLPLDDSRRYRWGLAGAFMNRADVLTRLEGPGAEARAACDLAIAHLSALTTTPDFDLPQRLGLAWTQRGLVAETAEEAIRCFTSATEVLASPANPRQALTRGHALLHRGIARLNRAGDPAAAAVDAVAVLESARADEQVFPAVAELALHARHLLCRALCHSLEEHGDSSAVTGDWIGDATDAIEEGLSLDRHWSSRGVISFRPLACQLFVLGLRIYRVCQPHFLAGFILDTLDPARAPDVPPYGADFLTAAALAIKQGLDDAVLRAAAATLNPERLQKELAILQALRDADAQLALLQGG